MVCKIGLTIFTIVEVVALALFVVGTPLAMFRSKTEDWDGNTACLTMWGYKTKCSDTKYDLKVGDIFDNSKCDTRKDLFQASEALSIISIVMFAACILMVLLMCCCACVACICRIILMILIVVGILSGAATFACMSYIYHTRNTQQDARILVKKSLLSDTASGSGHLTSGSSPMFAAGDDTEEPSTDAPVVVISGICDALKDSFKYGAGFILIIAGWALHTVNIAFALLPC